MHAKRALIVVDIQNDFLPGGTLAVRNGNRILPVVARLIEFGDWDLVVMTQDWHPDDHVSFASNHPGHHPFDTVTLHYGPQVLWPDHCVAGTQGAAFSWVIGDSGADAIIRKGFESDVDSYSAFCAADGRTKTGLEGLLREKGITDIYVCGLATDYCVNFTALDGAKAGFKTTVITDASAAIDVNGSLAAAHDAWKKAGVAVIESAALVTDED